MRRTYLLILAALMSMTTMSAQTFLNFNAGTDGVNFGVTTLLDAYPVTVIAPPPPRHHHPRPVVHIPMRPGYHYDAPHGHHNAKAAKKAAKKLRKAMRENGWVYYGSPRPHHDRHDRHHGYHKPPKHYKHHDKHRKHHRHHDDDDDDDD